MSDELLTPREERFLIFSNYLIGITVFLDLLHITEIIALPLQQFTLFNLIVLGIALQGFRIKRRVNEKMKSQS